MKLVPDIVITSYIGDDPVQQMRRFDVHLEQRRELKKWFPDLEILSICSGYPKTLEEMMSNFNCVFLPKRTYKFEKHNMVLENLYKIKKSKAVLFLDNDVLPVKIPEFTSDPGEVISHFLEQPTYMPAPCMFFSSKGLYADTFYRNRKEPFVNCPLIVAGWAILIRNDLQVMQSEDTLPIVDDLIFRGKCSAEGKQVIKHQHVFFRTLLGNYKYSTMVNSHEARLEEMAKGHQWLVDHYPECFTLEEGRAVPIWSGRNKKKLEALVAEGCLRRTEYGCVPVPEKLKNRKETKPQGFFDV